MRVRNGLSFKNITIYGEEDRDINPYFLFIEPLEWNKEKHKGFIKPHLHSNLFQIIIINSGEVLFVANNVEKLITKATIILIPEDNLHSLKFEKPSKGWTMSIAINLKDELLEKHPIIQSFPQSVKIIEKFNEGNTYKLILDLCSQIYDEQNNTDQGQYIFNTSMVGLIMYYIDKVIASLKTETTFNNHRKEYIHLRAFKKSIKQKIDASKKVKDYAAELRITPTHLNRLCNSLTGISASQSIYNILISESKKYLNHSSFTISEIAYLLNYKSPSHFSKSFRNQVGESPKTYRSRMTKE